MSTQISIVLPNQNQVTVQQGNVQGGGVESGNGNKFDAHYTRNFTNLQWVADGSEWVLSVAHNLGKNPSIQVVDSIDNIVYVAIEIIDENNVELRATSKFSGKAFFN